MKKSLLLLILFFFSYFSFSQNFKKVDQIIRYYPEINSIEELAQKIDYDFKNSDIEKVRAIYNWIILNITYKNINKSHLSTPQIISYSTKTDKEYQINYNKRITTLNAFKTREAVCEGYSLLFKRLCDLVNIENQLVYGYTKSSPYAIGFIPSNKNHVWNAVKINNKWLFFDTTYGAGYSYKGIWQQQANYSYFNVSNEVLNRTHFPAKKFWLQTLNQKPLFEFCNEPFKSEYYVFNNIKLLSPTKGTIKLSKKEKKLTLQFKNVKPNTPINYLYSYTQEIGTPLRLKNNKEITDISIKAPKQNTLLHIFIDHSLAVEYKIEIN